MFCVLYVMHAGHRNKHAIRVREVLTGNNLFWLNCHFLVRGGSSFAERTLDYCGCIDST